MKKEVSPAVMAVAVVVVLVIVGLVGYKVFFGGSKGESSDSDQAKRARMMSNGRPNTSAGRSGGPGASGGQ